MTSHLVDSPARPGLGCGTGSRLTGRGSQRASLAFAVPSCSPRCSRRTVTCSTGSTRSLSPACSGSGRARPVTTSSRPRGDAGSQRFCSGSQPLPCWRRSSSARRRDRATGRAGARRCGRLARCRVRRHGRPAPVGLPDPRRVRGARGEPARPPPRKQGRDRARRPRRLAHDDVRLPRRLQRLPAGEDVEAVARRRDLERSDAPDAEPDRRPDRTRRPARLRSCTATRRRRSCPRTASGTQRATSRREPGSRLGLVVMRAATTALRAAS